MNGLLRSEVSCRLLVLLLFLRSLLATAKSSSETQLDLEFQKFSEGAEHFGNELNKEEMLNKLFRHTVGRKFSCNTTRPNRGENTTSVHHLTPFDIQVVAAMGDSLTAGMGGKAGNLLTDLLQFRGMSFSIGGDGKVEDTATLPNVLKKFNPSLRGYSRNIGDEASGNAKLNVGVVGARSSDMLHQAKSLVQKMREDSRISFTQDWKLLTVFIGANDLCDVCKSSEHEPRNLVKKVQEALDYLHQTVPRMFVNVIPGLDLTSLNTFKSLFCKTVHILVCPCVVTDQEHVLRAEKQYRDLVRQLLESGRYDTRDDFTVVQQTFTENFTPPDDPQTMFILAPDCFHFSVDGHALSAQALWRNMFEPVGQKSTSWNPNEDFITCPSSPYFATRVNGQIQSPEVSAAVDVDPEEKLPYHAAAVYTLFAAIGLFCLLLCVWVLVLFLKHKNQRKEDKENKFFNPYYEYMGD